ncbi:MAG TPA: class I SAM-dependent methyltransferase [Bryobacteraceae bacterium]|jgi:ubiquinone/menaquinone biosynthesis C-methylase UbiE|nr:class I SAM-dependent methyltransferase [Bryobacteraceae bacterium]
MTTVAAGVPAFDKIAASYDRLWSDTAIGHAQRSAVWHQVDGLFRPGEVVMDLGCGTGVDGLHYIHRGLIVHGVDASAQMVEAARQRGVPASCCAIEQLDSFNGRLDGALSNFGALNCLPALDAVAKPLGRMIRRGGPLALCFLNRLCLWETAYYLCHANWKKAFRRWSGSTASSVGVAVYYPTARQILSAFRTDFEFVGSYGIGFAVPPSYVSTFVDAEINLLANIDRGLAHLPLLRALADHRLYIFRRR